MKFFIEVDGEQYDYPTENSLCEFCEEQLGCDSFFPNRVDRIWSVDEDNKVVEHSIMWTATLVEN